MPPSKIVHMWPDVALGDNELPRCVHSGEPKRRRPSKTGTHDVVTWRDTLEPEPLPAPDEVTLIRFPMQTPAPNKSKFEKQNRQLSFSWRTTILP